ncbi:hypothetical protein MRB53_010347 [Persea americana]|uniref:Uncharacterized protein n=1 Tax=Persea americana TaxID=3435 RepID=A0ACC2LRX8_PERAE|nr:hypothetical protein MRB53_010347 [Persea americana]
MSAEDGLKVGISGIQEDEVVMISVAFLVILFSAQRYGTSKLGLAVGPALFIWFCSLAGVGIYNLVKYDRCVEGFQSYSHLLFLQEEFITCLLSLGGCLLCVTGSEAMFADICYFSVRPVQLTFVFFWFCLALCWGTWAGCIPYGKHNKI